MVMNVIMMRMVNICFNLIYLSGFFPFIGGFIKIQFKGFGYYWEALAFRQIANANRIM